MTTSQVKEIKSLIIEALHTDGAHHKQWYLKKILAIVEVYFDPDDPNDWEKGIPP